MLEPGTEAPDIELLHPDDTPVSLADVDGEGVVNFHPKAGTRGCTAEACSFRDHWDAFRDAGVTVPGVSTDSVEENREFHQAENLPFDLLSDDDGAVANAEQSFQTVVTDDETDKVAERNTSVIDANGTVIEVYEDVSPEAHAEEVRATV